MKRRLASAAVLWRLRAELAHHTRLRREALRRAGRNRWRAWREARLALAVRAALYRQALRAWRDDEAPAPWRRPLRAWRPLIFLALTALLALAGPGHPWVAYSMLGRLPRPAWQRLAVISRLRPDSLAAFAAGRAGGDAMPYSQPCLPTFRIATLPSGRGELAVLQGTPPFFSLLGAATPRDGEAWIAPALARRLPRGARAIRVGGASLRIAGILPREESFLFRPALLWMRLPGDARLSVLQLSAVAELPSAPLPFRLAPQATPLAALALDDLSYARDGFACLLLLVLAAALGDLRRAPRRWAVARYWGYLAANAVSLGLLLYASCGCLVELWPRLGVVFAVISLDLWLSASLAAWRWWRDDRRFRCRTCLRRLGWPQPLGCWGGVLLTAPACEYLCTHGHGRLRVPAQSGQVYPRETWEYAQDWWRELVASA